MPVQLLPGVNLTIVPELLDALKKIETIYGQFGLPVVVTSANDKTHTQGSLHYIGAALDLKTKGLPANVKTQIYTLMKQVFPLPPWYVDLENLGGLQEHIHIQKGLAIRDKKTGKLLGYDGAPTPSQYYNF